MKLLRRRTIRPPAPGLRGIVRVDRRLNALLPRLRAGDVVLTAHQDLDREGAQRLVDAGVSAVLNTLPMISGRYPNLGPQVLADAGVVMIDRLGDRALDLLADGMRVRLHEGAIYPSPDDDAVALLEGRLMTSEQVSSALVAAREGLTAHLEAFTHQSTEFLRREQDLLLHGVGLPALSVQVAARPVVVVVPGQDYLAQLQSLRAFIKEQRPVLVGVGRGASALAKAGYRPDVIVLAAAELDTAPPRRVLAAASDVILLRERGAAGATAEPLERQGIVASVVETGATAEDAALILAEAQEPTVIVGVGLHTTIEEFLDRRRTGLASTYLTRLKVGHRLVDASAVSTVYSGQVRPRHLLAVGMAGLGALAAAISTTPVGQEWAHSLALLGPRFIDSLQGLLP